MFAIFAAVAMAVTTSLVNPTRCQSDLRGMLVMNEDEFDQGENGWRKLANDSRCFGAAAELIRAFRLSHRGHGNMLWWHEGQMRAAAGQTRQAIPLFAAARARPNEWNIDSGWNHYLDATVAFLKRDLPALLQARSILASLPAPSDQTNASPAAKTQARPAGWPPNLDVVDGLLRCFDKSYAEAVNPSCRPDSKGL